MTAPILRVRNMQPGDIFILRRTGDKYVFVGHDRSTPSGTRYVARRSGHATPSTLHHACHVSVIGGRT